MAHNWGRPDALRPLLLKKIFRGKLPPHASANVVAEALQAQKWGLSVQPRRQLPANKVDALVKKLAFIPEVDQPFYKEALDAAGTHPEGDC